MRCLFSYRKAVSIVLCISALALALAGCTGPAGPQGPAGAPGPSGPPGSSAGVKPVVIAVTPNVVELKKVNVIQISGSGFSPGSIVSVGIPGVPVDPERPEAKDIWFDAATINQFGGFAINASLSATLWRLVGKTISNEEVAGVYTVVATNKEGEVATAPLVVVVPKE